MRLMVVVMKMMKMMMMMMKMVVVMAAPSSTFSTQILSPPAQFPQRTFSCKWVGETNSSPI